jgi:hypothetical protein
MRLIFQGPGVAGDPVGHAVLQYHQQHPIADEGDGAWAGTGFRLEKCLNQSEGHCWFLVWHCWDWLCRLFEDAATGAQC